MGWGQIHKISASSRLDKITIESKAETTTEDSTRPVSDIYIIYLFNYALFIYHVDNIDNLSNTHVSRN